MSLRLQLRVKGKQRKDSATFILALPIIHSAVPPLMIGFAVVAEMNRTMDRAIEKLLTPPPAAAQAKGN